MIKEAELVDRAQITATLRRYSHGVDQREWALYRGAFAPGATVHVPGYLEAPMLAEQFQEFLQNTFDATRMSGQHLLANTLFDIRGQRARTVTEFLAVTTQRGERAREVLVQRSGGLYVDDLVRADGDWLITARVLVRKNDDRRVVAYDDTTFVLTQTAARNAVVAGL